MKLRKYLKSGFIKKHPFVFAFFLVFILIVVAVLVFIHIMSTPAEGTVSNRPTNIHIVKTQTKNPSQFNGKYISFKIPTDYKVVPSPDSGGYLESVNLYSTDHSSKSVAVAVIRESLSNDSAIDFRNAHPDLYKRLRDSNNNLLYIKDKNGSEKTAFIVNGDLVASVSLSSTFTRDLSGDYTTILKNFQWK
jgi:hypothetical protein